MMLLLAAMLLQDDVASLIERLGADDAAMRDSATTALIEKGEAALAELEAVRSNDPEISARVKAVVERIRRNLWTLSMAPERAECGVGDPIHATIAIENRTGAEQVFHGRFVVRVLDAEAREVGRFHASTKNCQTAGSCWLEQEADLVFKRVPDGGKLSLPVEIAIHPRLKGEKAAPMITAPGRYTLEATMSYDRAAHVGRAGCGCDFHDDPARLWNRAVEGSRTARAEFVAKR